MRIYEVWTSDDERRASCKATCDCLESALEFSKTINEWYHSESLYDTIMKQFGTFKNLKENLNDCYNIREKELVTLGTLANK